MQQHKSRLLHMAKEPGLLPFVFSDSEHWTSHPLLEFHMLSPQCSWCVVQAWPSFPCCSVTLILQQQVMGCHPALSSSPCKALEKLRKNTWSHSKCLHCYGCRYHTSLIPLQHGATVLVTLSKWEKTPSSPPKFSPFLSLGNGLETSPLKSVPLSCFKGTLWILM